MKKEKIFIAIPIVLIVALLGVIGYQLIKSQVKSTSNAGSTGGPAHSIGTGGQGTGGQGQSKGLAPGGSLQQEK